VRTAYDEIIATAVKRQNQLQRIISELLAAELSEKRARSIKYQMTIAKLPLATEIKEFDFEAAKTMSQCDVRRIVDTSKYARF
jgi:DNA replication protein DnaC